MLFKSRIACRIYLLEPFPALLLVESFQALWIFEGGFLLKLGQDYVDVQRRFTAACADIVLQLIIFIAKLPKT